jgi:peptide/nickel transport system substrate-binding protein
MRNRARATRRLVTAGAIAAVAVVTATLVPGASATSGSATGSAASAHKCLVMTGSGDAAFTHSFNPYTGPTLNGNIMKGAIYEPLLVASVAGGGHLYPWLATSWKWSNANKTLTLQIVKNAKWSDGKPLTPADVVYSLTAGKQDKTMDIIGLTRAGTNIASVKRSGPNGVAINLKTPDSQFIAANLNLQFVVPQHVWSKVKKVATFTNPNPVGSGPFDQIGRLTNQDIVFNKNPNYWLASASKLPCLEYQETASNDAALLAIQSGKVDWTHNFVPNVESAYEAKDPAHYHAFYSTTAYPISLTFDDTAYPFSLVALRQAISMSINRSDVSKLGEYGYAPPTDAIGLNGIFPQWVTDPTIKAQAQALAAYNPDGAKKLLTDNGFTYQGSNLIDPKGNPVAFDIHVISGWSDWVASLQIITKNLQGIGINAQTKLEPDYNTWSSAAFSTKTPTLLWQNASQGSPYGFFFANLSQNAMIASGEDGTSTGNWEHFSDASATGLLNQWKTALNPDVQHTLATKLEAAWLRTMPVVPLFVGPRWSTYSTKYFHGFASPKNAYADPIFTTFPDNVVSFTRIAPGGKAGA